MFTEPFQEAKRGKSKTESIWGSRQVSYDAEVGPLDGMDLAVKNANEGEGHVQEDWKVFPEVMTQVCTHLNEAHFETILKEC